MTIDAAQAIADTRRWVDRAVIGLQLCPFAKAVQAKGQAHYAVHQGDDLDLLAERLLAEAQALRAMSADARDTTLLIVPDTLHDFYDFHDFTGRCERLMRRAGHEGELQLASFHPRFQFAGADEDDLGNFSNRSPHPTLHLLREASIDRAVEAFPDAAAIFERNIDTLQALGRSGWTALDVGPGAGERP